MTGGTAGDGSNATPVLVGVQPQLTTVTMGVVDAARIAEERGFRSFYLSEHTHIPVEGKSVSPRGFVPEWVKRIWDPYVALSWVAATTSMEIGTAVTLIAEHDPIALAKTIATLDSLSGGRLVLGVGWGWNREEFEDHTGIPAAKRVPVLREKILAMRALWTQEEAEFHGTYVNIPKSWSWPKPAQAGGPPIMIGAPAAEKNFARIADFADGWFPMSPAFTDDAFPDALAALRRAWAEAGRTGEPLVAAMAGRPSADELSRTIERAASLGVQKVFVSVDEDSMADYERILDRCAPALARFA